MIPRGYRKWLRIWRGRVTLWLLQQEGVLARAFGLRGLHAARIARLVRRTGLFDAEHYLEHNPDVAGDGVDPLAHYVRYGDREGRQPMPLFDPAFYRAHAGKLRRDTLTLLHYWLLGRYLKVSPSAWFDLDFYLRQNRDVARAGFEPLTHFLRFGGSEGRSPSRQFDCAYYLLANPDVGEAGINPLLHYLRFGRVEGRPVNSAGVPAGEGEQWEPFVLPAVADSWEHLQPRAGAGAPLVDVVVPVYKGAAETLRCLYSVLAAPVSTPFELVVIDDASPDGELMDSLRGHARAGLFTLLHNEANRGYVATTNRGMQLHPGRDVVVLNADTEVYGDWLDRLRATASAAGVASVTPLSNNATIASYPRFLHDNPYPLELSFAELDALAAGVNAGLAVEVPTGIGFCMYIPRACLDAIGMFDEETFGRGYGEENDFCQRAIAAGWRNLIAGDVFVHHVGSVSFQGERAKRVARALQQLNARYPGYTRSVQQFIEADPMAPLRANLDHARLRAKTQDANVLLISHNRGGGTERHVREDTAMLLAAGSGVFYLRPVQGSPGLVRLSHPEHMHLPNLPAFEFADTEAIAAVLRGLRIGRVHNHGLVDFTAEASDHLLAIVAAAGAALDIEIHDYQVICPRLNLAGEDGRYCGEPDTAACNACLARNGSKFGVRDIEAWRAVQGRMLAAASSVWVPDADVRDRLERYFPAIDVAVSPHEELVPAAAGANARAAAGAPVHIAVVGAIGRIKGYDVLLECARDAQQRRLPLRFSLLGYSLDDRTLLQAGVTVSGRYLEHEAHERLRAMEPDAVWLPSLWPETYSYTLSLALQCGYPVFAFDIGAIGRRLREFGLEQHLVPLESQYNPRALNQGFLRLAGREPDTTAHRADA